jgi:formate hydrogenlyase subunit 3/multisubunit Na+/H+ antiporter MnhD subunit
MSFLAPAPALLLLFAGAALLLFGPRIRSDLLGLGGIAAATIPTILLWRGEGRGSAGSFDGDPFSLFLTGVVLAALAVALSAGRERSAGRLLIGGALALLALSTRDLLWAVTAIQILVIAVEGDGRPGRRVLALLAAASFAILALIAWSAGGTDLAVVAASDSSSPVVRIGLALLLACLIGTWVFQTRRALRYSTSGVVDDAASSFILLVAVISVAMRLAAWLPGALEGAFLALALTALVLGALGLLGSTRITTFLTALTIARGGAVLLPLLGGAHGRGPLLLELVTSGFSVLLVALAVDLAAREKKADLHSMDDLGNVAFPVRLLLLVGALSAASFPPFPGFFARFAVASTILSEGQWPVVAACSVLMFLAALGAMRLVTRAWAGVDGASSSGRTRGELVGLGLAAAGGVFLLVFPRALAALAARAALGIQ